MMRHITRLVVFFVLSLFLASAGQPQGLRSIALITEPSGGEAVQGIVQITGSVGGINFSRYEISYQLNDDPTDAWFLINSGTQAVNNAPLGEWATTNLRDDDYSLHLEVFFSDGNSISDTIDLVRVRNYSPIETSTPAVVPTQNPIENSTSIPNQPSNVLPPTPTEFPQNPARLETEALWNSLKIASVSSVIGLITLWLYAKRKR